jgi:hypothetical protein
MRRWMDTWMSTSLRSSGAIQRASLDSVLVRSWPPVGC